MTTENRLKELAATLHNSMREGVSFTLRKRLRIEWDAVGNVAALRAGAGTHIVAL